MSVQARGGWRLQKGLHTCVRSPPMSGLPCHPPHLHDLCEDGAPLPDQVVPLGEVRELHLEARHAGSVALGSSISSECRPIDKNASCQQLGDSQQLWIQRRRRAAGY